MKTNSKQVKESVKKYVLECIDTEQYNTTNLKESLQVVAKRI